jgi:hypothetical protein
MSRGRSSLFHDSQVCGRPSEDWKVSIEHLRSDITTCTSRLISIDLFQSFDAVTIMFSELVGFNSSTVQDAMELVSTMNAVFSCFDSLMDKFDVYKVPFTPSHQHHLHPSPITLFFRGRDRSISFLSRVVIQRLKIFSQGGNCGADLHGGQWRPRENTHSCSKRL